MSVAVLNVNVNVNMNTNTIVKIHVAVDANGQVSATCFVDVGEHH